MQRIMIDNPSVLSHTDNTIDNYVIGYVIPPTQQTMFCNSYYSVTP
ncbi:hypothetical protein [Vibrio phage JSF2]|nr:hypothetical protein [Vibrio phage JSF4]ASV41313.1 hypothetical protein [Vibrio phage JSF5]ASV42088.1 hypothetical protein [Vibrio phage JSF2]